MLWEFQRCLEGKHGERWESPIGILGAILLKACGGAAGYRVRGLPCSVIETLDLGQPGWAPAAREVMFKLLGDLTPSWDA